MGNELKRKRMLKKAHKLADRADFLIRHIVTSIKTRRSNRRIQNITPLVNRQTGD